jgi:hypothetical protein
MHLMRHLAIASSGLVVGDNIEGNQHTIEDLEKTLRHVLRTSRLPLWLGCNIVLLHGVQADHISLSIEDQGDPAVFPD